MSTGDDTPSSPASAPPPELPYPTTQTNPDTSNPPAPLLPYPTSNQVYPVDPAYPPPNSLPNSQTTGGETTSPSTGESTPILSSDGATQHTTGGKGPELPPYSDPPPSYADSYPVPQPTQQQQPAYPPAGYGTQAQYVAPQSQDMIRVVGSQPVHIECPSCHQQVLTNTRLQSGILVYLVAFVCILFGGIFGCCLIPFCIPGLKDVYHTCPNCKHMIGRYDRMS